jgi:late competence protein required for DNA uptake (superfamily II DNA/RNA helicase)
MKLIQETVENDGRKLKCQRCEHEWTYKGSNPYICTCPYCRTTVTVNKKKIFLEKTAGTSSFVEKSEVKK